MRILYAATFDPAGVMASHRAALRHVGVEAYLALDADYRDAKPDLMCPKPDVIVVAPGIGWGQTGDWGMDPAPHIGRDLDLSPAIWEILDMFPDARRVAYFHGSVQTQANREGYRRWYGERDFRIAASTLDYAVHMGAAYLPPMIAIPTMEARRRIRGEPLVVAHTPTNPDLCSTDLFLAIAKDLGITVKYATGVPHAEALATKHLAHATYDHLRGSFSMNSLEGAAEGTIPLFGLGQREEDRLRAEGFFMPPTYVIRNGDGLLAVLTMLRDSVGLTRTLQAAARPWASQFGIDAIGLRLKRFYEEVLA
jgi:hypothetical protein